MSDTAKPSDLVAAIADVRPTLSKKLDAIAAHALEKPEQFIRNTSRDICAELGTSEPTLIKFCQSFGYAGLSDFRIDLALSLARPGTNGRFFEPLADDRRKVNLAAKRQIAAAAAQVVKGDQSLLIDNGTTAEAFAEALGALPALTIMTTGLRVAQNALAHKHHTVMMTGGRIRPNALSMAGRMVETSIGLMNFDTFVMGADSVDPDSGLSTFQEDEAHNTRFMISAARRVIVLADKTKILKPSLHRICEMRQIDMFVTDIPPDSPHIAKIEAQGVAVVSTPSLHETEDAVA